jgi:glyoxylase-like metal-dependent hydrolase (beta-lactamase superfamily II)
VVPDAALRDTAEAVAEDVFRLPLPFRGMQVNTYLVLGDDAPRLIDTGVGDERSTAALAAHLASFGYRFEDIAEVLVTHAHPDHVGFAPALAAAGARILMHPLEAAASAREHERFDPGWLLANGLPAELALAVTRPPRPALATAVLGDGEELSFGRLRLQLLVCAGHSPAQVCAFDADRAILFSADQLLRVTTPIATTEPGEGDAVGDYLAGLERLRPLPAERVLPGHGRSFGTFRGILEAARSGQVAKTEQVRRALPPDGANAYELAQALDIQSQFSPGLDPSLVAALSLGRVAAYLRHLEELGAVVVENGGGTRVHRPRQAAN